MRDEQRIIADWMRRQLQRKGWTGQEWAELAGLSGSTVTRAMKEDYTSVTSIPTLHALARVADAPSPLDILAGEIEAERGVPSEKALSMILAAILPDRHDSENLPLMARRLSHGLAVLSRNQESEPSPDYLKGMTETLAEIQPQ